MAPRSEDPAIADYDAEFIPGSTIPSQPMDKGQQHMQPSESVFIPVVPLDEDAEEEQGKSKSTTSWLDLDLMACCGLGNKGTCSHCGQLVLNSQLHEPVEDMPGTYVHTECVTLRNENATKIQSVARGKMGREHVTEMKAEIARKAAAARRREEARLRAEEQARLEQEERERQMTAEAELEDVDLDAKDRSLAEKPEKKGFFSKIFGGCKGKSATTDAVVVETTVEEL
mmetsp:Transcript_15094/g.42575  ORF Transcript_15094/g.42575 Transcript_15094/m.42575 type:complete len:228 (-) Transcript_15094:302-985(-)|eukprot:CAMPEP_0119561102 /NCGR_PEP_ID=MMETSP1352-20130426/16709_1 /TAXON_ID=265584 /ORGANISM="Stauroneis constricta, Strain CCMP1120" /LENGTH=227 /DNA_ID=CAMNT_0007609227 /DNA_START=76 /DNA_END=759 /DNA_ORIENTATION=-